MEYIAHVELFITKMVEQREPPTRNCWKIMDIAYILANTTKSGTL